MPPYSIIVSLVTNVSTSGLPRVPPMFLCATVRALRSEPRSLADLVRANIRELTPYRCARDDYSDGVLLDANENSFGPALAPGKVGLAKIVCSASNDVILDVAVLSRVIVVGCCS